MHTALPPKIDGGARAAIFSTNPAAHVQWYVSIGTQYFLTSERTARRLLALGQANASYAAAYKTYAADFPEAESFADFVSWCETNRASLSRLSAAHDDHSLRVRRIILSGPLCTRIGRRLSFLFAPRVCVAISLAAVAIAGLWVTSPPAYRSAQFDALSVAIILLGMILHELGHASASVRFGLSPGGIGVGVYWIWPAFFADVRHSWCLPQRQRAVVSAAGVYFQAIYAAALTMCSMALHMPQLQAAIEFTIFLMITTLNPIFKFDGYWILSDLLNVNNLHKSIEGQLRKLARQRAPLLRIDRASAVALAFAASAAAYFAYVGYGLARLTLGELTEAIMSSAPLFSTAHEDSAVPSMASILIHTLRSSITALGVALILCALCVMSYRRCAALVRG